ncbi:MAG: hypothetical protein QNJ46_17555 [Leptolyngbyaceae cyanobacterium MO_188.B28]|nr:hypothetical protein [Leptolyngbyaceae cyanobacterium MO_188.B28]
MVWIYLIVQGVFLWMLGRRVSNKHDGVYTVMFDIISILSLLFGLIMAPLLVKVLPFLLIAPSRIFPNLDPNAAWTQQSLAETIKESLYEFVLNLGEPLEDFLSRFGVNLPSLEDSQRFTSFSATSDYDFNWRTFKDIIVLLVGSLAAWASYLYFRTTHSIPENLTTFEDRQVS